MTTEKLNQLIQNISDNIEHIQSNKSQLEINVSQYSSIIDTYQKLKETAIQEINLYTKELDMEKEKLEAYNEQLKEINNIAVNGNIVGYCRESKLNKNVNSQQETIYNKYGIIPIYNDNIPGNTNPLERPQFKLMINFLRTHCIEAVCVNSLDRLGRSTILINQALNVLLKYVNKIIAIRESVVLTIDNISEHKNLIQEIGNQSETERIIIGKRLNEGRKIAIMNGVKMGRKTGSKITKDEKAKKYEIELSMLKQGLPIRKIAKITGKGQATIARLKAEFNINRRIRTAEYKGTINYSKGKE